MNPRQEAYDRLDGRYDVRVLEPSPPAVEDPPWFADDPVARGAVGAGRMVVSPVGTGEIRWEELAEGDPTLSDWCAERWLAAYRRLEPAPATLGQTRLGLHKLAEQLISPARRRANGKIGLRYTRSGFGTPFFAQDVQLRVAGVELIVQEAGRERRAQISTLAQAADHVGPDALPDDVKLDSEPLKIDPAASHFIADWYGFAASVLEELRAEQGDEVDDSRVQLWPEHFDLAIELGRADAGARGAYGLSPGDAQHPEPYLYVAPWIAPPPGDLWQARTFSGAELPYAALLAAEDQRETALGFFRTRLAVLTGQVNH